MDCVLCVHGYVCVCVRAYVRPSVCLRVCDIHEQLCCLMHWPGPCLQCANAWQGAFVLLSTYIDLGLLCLPCPGPLLPPSQGVSVFICVFTPGDQPPPTRVHPRAQKLPAAIAEILLKEMGFEGLWAFNLILLAEGPAQI